MTFGRIRFASPSGSGNKSDLDQICLKIIVPMFNHFDMTSNLGDGSSMLGWFNDKHCQSFDMNKSFTYMCNLSCNFFMPLTPCDNIVASYFTTFYGCSCITVSHVPQLRSVKMDDIYIYNVYTLSLLLATFQIKQHQGRLCFQEGEDDEDMATTVTSIFPNVLPLGTIARAQIRQLNYQVLPFLGYVSSVHENMMLPNLDTFVLLAIEGPSTGKKVENWSMVKHGDEGVCEENKNRGSSGDFRTLKPP